MHPIDTSVPQFATTFRGTRIVVTLNLISEVLYVPRVAYPNYPSCGISVQCLEMSLSLTFVRNVFFRVVFLTSFA